MKKILRSSILPGNSPSSLGSAAHISKFSSFSLPSRLIVSVGTFIAPIENSESRPRKGFVCSAWMRLTKNPVSVLIPYRFQTFLSSGTYFPIQATQLYWSGSCFVSVNEFRSRSVERLICFPTSVFVAAPLTWKDAVFRSLINIVFCVIPVITLFRLSVFIFLSFSWNGNAKF